MSNLIPIKLAEQAIANLKAEAICIQSKYLAMTVDSQNSLIGKLSKEITVSQAGYVEREKAVEALLNAALYDGVLEERALDKQQALFENWWFAEGSSMAPKAGEDAATHTYRLTKIAWVNGAYCATPEEAKKRFK